MLSFCEQIRHYLDGKKKNQTLSISHNEAFRIKGKLNLFYVN